MKTKQSVVLVSASALTAGMAQGAVVYSGPLNLLQTSGAPESRQPVDINGDGVSDFTFGYESDGVTKPYVDVRLQVSSVITEQSGMVKVLGYDNKGLPATPAGTMIDLSYATSYPVIGDNRGYMLYDDMGENVIGDWSATDVTDAFVGVQLDMSGETHYGWLHFIDDPTGSPATLTLVDWAYESTAGVGIETMIVPEPAAGTLAGMGMAAWLMLCRRRQAPTGRDAGAPSVGR